MKQPVKLIVVVPVGPVGSSYSFHHLVDTISSIIHYTDSDRRIIIQDNSAPTHVGEKIQECFPDLTVIRTPQNYGFFAGVYKALSLAFLFAQANYDFQAIIKMDIDALMIGSGIADDAIRYFNENPAVGMLGNYLCEGEGIEWPRKQLLRQSGIGGLLRDQGRWNMLRKLTAMAQARGYRPGEHILGGAMIFNPKFIDKLVRQGLLLRDEIYRAYLGDDHLFSLLCKAVGMDMADFCSPSNPMAVVWKGMPASPEELVRSGKKLIHSTRFWQQMNEEQIRGFFEARRTQNEKETPASVVELRSTPDLMPSNGHVRVAG